MLAGTLLSVLPYRSYCCRWLSRNNAPRSQPEPRSSISAQLEIVLTLYWQGFPIESQRICPAFTSMSISVEYAAHTGSVTGLEKVLLRNMLFFFSSELIRKDRFSSYVWWVKCMPRSSSAYRTDRPATTERTEKCYGTV